MTTTPDPLAIARQLQQAGHLPEADAHYDRGNVLLAQGQLDDAIASYRQALQREPDHAEAHNNLGTALLNHGQLDEAFASYQRAVELNPNFADAYYNLGTAFQRQGSLDLAQACYKRALAIQPHMFPAHFALGVLSQARGEWDHAIYAYQKSLDLQPDSIPALNNLGNLCAQQWRLDEAASYYRRAIAHNPNVAELHNNLGNVLRDQRKIVEAAASYRRAIELNPNYADAHSHLGNALKDLCQLDAAVTCYQLSLQLHPHRPDTLNNLGLALHLQGHLDAAADCHRRALQLDPQNAYSHWCQSLLLLLRGNFEQGWPEYEWRWRSDEVRQQCGEPLRTFSTPLWDGTRLDGKTIYIFAEQGLGDTLQFVRYLSLLKDLGGRVILECQKPLLTLLQKGTADELVCLGDPVTHFDTHAPLLSLPAIQRTTLATIPRAVPYLFADQALVEHWRERLSDLPGLRIGINWQGRDEPGIHQLRNVPLEYFEALADRAGISFISLQRGSAAKQLTASGNRTRIQDFGDDLDVAHGAFMDTAAIMMNLDLVITSDTAVAHLAGALGIPVWVVLPFVPDWRWLLDRDDTPWYPAMRLFRQKQPGDWPGVFREISAAMEAKLAGMPFND